MASALVNYSYLTDSESEDEGDTPPVTFSFPIPVNFSVPTPADAAVPPAAPLFFTVPTPVTSAGAGLPAAVGEDVPQLHHQSGHRVAAVLQTAGPTAGVLQVVDLVVKLVRANYHYFWLSLHTISIS